MRVKPFVTTALVLAIPLAGVAQAAVPSASTGGARDITQTSATLKGSINPNGEPTTYYFQYGTTKGYGAQTPTQGPTAATSGNVPVSASVSGLAPATTYHYRLVAVNASGTKLGGDKTFKTLKPPPSITLGASRTRVVYGGLAILSGQFTPAPGGSAAGVKITLQQNLKAIATAKTDAAGRFSFTQMPATNSTFRAISSTSPKATSGNVVVQVAFKVTVSLSTAHPRRGHRVVFTGTVGPVRNGALVRIQKRVGSGWRTVKAAIIGPSPNPQLSQYRVGVRVRRSGVYRAYVAGDSVNVAGASRLRRITPR